MSSWKNDNLVLYHGCSEESLRSTTNTRGLVVNALPHGIDLSVAGQRTEFGPGFYATTWEHQARSWANVRSKQRSAASRAVVLRFEVSRDALARLESLVFTNENCGFWSFVEYCRSGHPPHGRAKSATAFKYDVIYGPVSLWPQYLVIKDCDQVSFHTPKGLGIFSLLTVAAVGNPFFEIIHGHY
jgi:hypothetical protein